MYASRECSSLWPQRQRCACEIMRTALSDRYSVHRRSSDVARAYLRNETLVNFIDWVDSVGRHSVILFRLCKVCFHHFSGHLTFASVRLNDYSRVIRQTTDWIALYGRPLSHWRIQFQTFAPSNGQPESDSRWVFIHSLECCSLFRWPH